MSLRLFLMFYALFMLAWAYMVAPVHDYSAYLTHWDLVLSGGDPWQKMPAANAYGPIYNLFAFPYLIDIQLPKLLFVLSWLLITLYVVSQFQLVQSAKRIDKVIFSVFWLANPFFIVGTVHYGFNDSFVALLVFLGLLSVLVNGKGKLGVALVTVAVLTKLYPVFLLPFFAKTKKVLIKYFILFLGLVVFVYGLTYLIWDFSFLNAFGKANGRDPTLFSIMRFLNGELFPFKTFAELMLLFSSLFILLGIWFVFSLYRKGLIAQHTALLAALTVVFTFYKAGQFQFYLTYFAVFSVWALIEFRGHSPNRMAFFAVLLLGGWFALMAGIIYPLFNWYNGEYSFIREWIGLPTFLMQLTILYLLLFKRSISVEFQT